MRNVLKIFIKKSLVVISMAVLMYVALSILPVLAGHGDGIARAAVCNQSSEEARSKCEQQNNAASTAARAAGQKVNGSCASITSSKGETPLLDSEGKIQKDSKGNTITKSQSNIVSNNGLIAFLCGGSTDQSRNAIEVIIENIANYVLGISTFLLSIMLILGVIQIGASGGSSGGVQAGKKRIAAAVGSMSLFFLARIFFDLTGITGGRFLGVDVAGTSTTQGWNRDTLTAIIAAVWAYLSFLGGALSVTFIIFGGIRMMTSAGNPQAIKQASKIITYAAISLVAIGGIQLVQMLVKLVITGSQ